MIHLQQAPFLAQLIVRYRLFAAAILIVLAATTAWRIPYLHSDAFPDLSQTQVTIDTTAPGLAAEEVEQLVTFPLESRLKSLHSVRQMRSTSSTDASKITVIFDDAVSSQEARQLVSEQLIAAAGTIPKEASTPQIGADVTSLSEVYEYALFSPTRDPADLRSISDSIANRILRPIPGVADVAVVGGGKRQYHVEMDAAKLAQYKLSAAQVIAAIQNDNLNAGGGYIYQADEHEAAPSETRYTLRGVGRFEGGESAMQQLAAVPIAWQGSHPLTVGDVATVNKAASRGHSYASLRTREHPDITNVVTAVVMLRSGADASNTLNHVRSVVPQIETSLPADVTFVPLYDQGELIGEVTDTLFNALYTSTALIAVVLLLFLLQFRATLIILLSIPVSVAITLLIFERLGTSTNLMTLGGLTIGMVALIDSSIVVMDAVVRKLAFSPSAAPRDIIADSISEVARPVMFAAFVVSAFFLPLLTLDGLGGKLFSPLAIAAVLAQLCGLVTALLILPSVAALFYKRPVKPRRNPPMQRLIQRYRQSLVKVLGTSRLWIVGLVGALLIAAILTPRAGSNFIPELEEGTLKLDISLPAGTSVEDAARLAPEIDSTLASFPETRYSSSRITRSTNGTEIRVTIGLTDPRGWTSAKDRPALTTVIGRKLAAFPDITYRFSQPIAAGVDEMLSGTQAQIAVKIYGPDMADLQTLTQQAGDIIKAVPGTTGIALEDMPSEPRLSVRPKRTALADHGITVAQVMNVISDAFGEANAGQVVDSNQNIDIMVGLQQSDKDSITSIYQLGLNNAQGQWVSLSELVNIEVGTGPAWIRHEHGERRMLIGVNAHSSDLSRLIGRLRNALTTQLELPLGYRYEIVGEHQDQQHSLNRLAWAGAIAALVILIALRYSLGGFRQALLVMALAPLAGIGGHFALVWTGQPLSVPAAVGYLAVAGLSILNGVVLIDAINQKRASGCAPYDAIMDGAAGRLRPVLITATTTVVGLLPLMFSDGAGAELQRPLATVMVGGLITATLLTLWVLPANYKWSTQTREAKAVRQSLDV